MVLRKWLFFFSVLGFLPVEGAEASFSRGRGSASVGFQSSVVSYKVVENEFSTSERSVLDVCPGCLSGDKTAEEIKLLSASACEQVVKGEQCQGVEPKYLRDCENEEEEGTLAFGQRVLGCMKGTALEGAIGLGIGAVIGKVIVGIGALLSVPFVAPALGVAAGGGATLYAFSEYDRAYREVEPGSGRALRATGQMFGNIGTGLYRLFLGNYECYNPQGRAWEVCGLLLGGVAGGGAALATVKKAAAKAKPAPAAKPNPPVQEAVKKGPFSGWGLTQYQEKLLHRKINPDYHEMILYNNVDEIDYIRLASLRGAGISMDDIAKAFRLPHVTTKLKNSFEERFTDLKSAKKLLGQTEDLSDKQIEGVNDLLDFKGWESVVRGMRKTGLSVDDGLSLRRSRKTEYIDRSGFQQYMQRREAVEKSIGHQFTEEQSEKISMLQMYFREGKDTLHPKDKEYLSAYIRKLNDSGLSLKQLRKVVNQNLISDVLEDKRQLKAIIYKFWARSGRGQKERLQETRKHSLIKYHNK